MYICVCNGITEKRIRQAVDAGATTLEQLRAHLGVGSNCRSCEPMAEEILQQRLRENESHSDARTSVF
jgi:bacterioferritin-associated ferredoxin